MCAFGGEVAGGEGRLREAVQRRCPIWGWREAEQVVEEVMRDWSEGLGERRWVLNEEALRATWWQQQDEWTQEVYDTYAFVPCVLRLYEDAVDFLDVWWSAALGNFNWEVPGASYMAAEQRGAFLWSVFDNPTTPRLITPRQGVTQMIYPNEWGACRWEGAMRPGGMVSFLDSLNVCEQRFLFGVVYMMYTSEERGWRMLCVLEDIVRMRQRGEVDTECEAVMGRQWTSSWVTALMLRTAPGQRLAAPRNE